MSRLLLLLLTLFLAPLSAQDAAPKKGPRLTGGLSAGGFFYESTGPTRRPPTGYLLNANLNFRVGQFSLPFMVSLNDQGATLNNPFNRLGISPTYKWATLHLGHRNISFSPFVLNGTTFFGAGAELKPGKLRLSALYGRFQRARVRRVDDALPVDFEYQRNGYSVRLGVGSQRNYFDLIYFRAADEVGSLPLDTTFRADNFPQANTVLGLSTRREFFKGKLFFTADGGLSLFTRNRRAAALGEERQEIVDRLSFLVDPNISTAANYAGEAGLQLRLPTFGLGLNYRRVMPDYRSLGVNYLLDDTETITIAPRLTLAKGKVNLTGSLGLQRNNLLEQRQAATFRQIGSANFDYQGQTGLGLSLNYSNYRLDQQVVRDEVLNDSILLNQVNHQVSFSPRYFKANKAISHMIVLTTGWQQLDDQNPGTSDIADNQVLLVNLNYSGRLKPGGWRWSAGVNLFQLTSKVVGNDRYGASLGLGKQLGDRLLLRTRLVYNRLMNTAGSGSNYQASATARFTVSKQAGLEATFGRLVNDFAGRDFAETRGRVRFTYRWR
ncbi:MAG: hypothetical protein AAF597_07470 [Bacteroidota bacterium]